MRVRDLSLGGDRAELNTLGRVCALVDDYDPNKSSLAELLGSVGNEFDVQLGFASRAASESDIPIRV